ncbi:MAG: Ig-like domain-containing protein, partial [Verrucomicrobia bacterium]|nr:Ig-like domain-containing protein [Verrucomicrobiota bacterium]
MVNPAFSAVPVAVDDTYVVDIGGTVSVRSSYSTTMADKSPSLFWNLNDLSLAGNAPTIPHTIDSGSDSVDGTGFLYSTSASINLSNDPLLAPSGGFKGFASSNVWWELGDADSGVGGNGGYIQNVVNPKTAWGSEVGSISMWFRIPADKTGLNDPITFGKSVIFAGVNTSDYDSLPYSVYKTSVVIFYSESKLSFNLYQNGSTLSSFTTSSTFNDNAWHHLVASWDNATGNVAAFHVDGGSLAGAAKSYTGQSYYDLTTDFTFDVRLQVGQGEFPQTAFNGFIDELAIWTEDALTAADARDLYFAGIGGPLSNDSDADGEAITWDAADINKAGLGAYVFNLTIQDTGGGFDFDGTGVAAGNYSFTYKATAGGEKSGDATITIKVNGPPTGVNDSGYVTAPGNVLNVDVATGVLANDSDPNVDTLSAFIASNPADGTLTLNADGSFTYDATSATAATKTFTYKVSDGSLEAGPYTVTIIVSDNDPPVITQGDSISFTMSEEGNPTAWSTPTIVATDGDSNVATQLTWSLLTAASNGTANVSGTAASPTITYAPNADYNGTDSFVVQVIDETTLTDTITVNVTISNVDDDPVVGNAIADVNATEDDADLVVDLTNVFNDVDDANASITKVIQSNSNSALVTSTISGDNLTLDYQADQSGSATITVRATSNGETVDDAFTVTVTAVDDPPVVANAIADVSANQDAADLVIDLSNVFNDVDDANASITQLVTANDNTSLVTTSFAGNNLTLDFQASQTGTANITVQATSNSKTVDDTFVVTVTPSNFPPVITQGAGPLAVTMSEDGSPTVWVAPTLGATDANTAAAGLTWSVSSAATDGTATVSGAGSIPATFTYVPNADFNGSDSFVVQVSDGALTDTITVNVTVSGVSDAPVITQGAGPLAVTMSEDGVPTAWAAPTLGATDAETADSALVWSVSSAASSGTADVSGTA